MIKSLFAAAALAVGASSSMAASTVDVTADIYSDGTLDETVTFSGTDTNSDGSLSLDELTSFSVIFPVILGSDLNTSLSGVSSFGTYNIGTNTWSMDAEILDNGNYYPGAWFTWDNYMYQIVSPYFTVVTTETIEVSAVPEPTNAAFILAGLGLLAAVARRRASKQV